MADIFNILIVGLVNPDQVFMGKILKLYGAKAHPIKKVVDDINIVDLNSKLPQNINIRYLIDSSIYSLDQNYSLEDLVSPSIPLKEANLVIGLNPIETYKYKDYISEKTVVLININLNVTNYRDIQREVKKRLPSIGEIIDLLDQLARKTISMNFSELAQLEFQNSKFTDCIILGIITKEFIGLLNKKLITELISQEKEIGFKCKKAFALGYNLI
jgi:hypothetical protein